MLSSDIDEVILSALQQVFTAELITALAGDALQLRTLKQADLQDDPTLTAPYLVFQDDPDKGVVRMPHELEHMYGMVEIGGPVRYLHYYRGKFGSPLATTRGDQRAQIATMASRIQGAIEKYYDLSFYTPQLGILASADYSKRLEGANTLLVDKFTKRIYGGEQTFYGEGHIYWHYPVSYYM